MENYCLKGNGNAMQNRTENALIWTYPQSWARRLTPRGPVLHSLGRLSIETVRRLARERALPVEVRMADGSSWREIDR